MTRFLFTKKERVVLPSNLLVRNIKFWFWDYKISFLFKKETNINILEFNNENILLSLKIWA